MRTGSVSVATKGLTLDVHLAFEPDAELRPELLRRLDPSIRLTVGEAPSHAAFEVLVAGVPEPSLLDASPSLRTLVVPFAGLPGRTRERLLDRRHITAHTLHDNAPAVAEMAVALLLAAAKRLVPIDGELRRGDWTSRYASVPSLGLASRHAVVLGYGAIGRPVAACCAALGMHVTAVRQAPGHMITDSGIIVRPGSDLTKVVAGAAALMVTVPLTDATRGMVDRSVLESLADDAIVVNVGRGPTIDEQALFEALERGTIGGAGIDVWYAYPENDTDVTSVLPSRYPFHSLPQVVMSPHRASEVARSESLRMAGLVTTLNALARGEPAPHPVDVEAGY